MFFYFASVFVTILCFFCARGVTTQGFSRETDGGVKARLVEKVDDALP